jgi:hypothetical protein
VACLRGFLFRRLFVRALLYALDAFKSRKKSSPPSNMIPWSVRTIGAFEVVDVAWPRDVHNQTALIIAAASKLQHEQLKLFEQARGNLTTVWIYENCPFTDTSSCVDRSMSEGERTPAKGRCQRC